MFMDELRHFLACIRGDERPLVDLREASRSMLIGEIAKESIATGKAVRVAYE
jgi:predicted dehydrogenase